MLVKPATADGCDITTLTTTTLMIILIKIALGIFLIFWTVLGAWLVLKFGLLFASEKGAESDSAGSKTLSMAHFASMWIGGFGLAVYFLFR
jgi:hypothetical protein